MPALKILLVASLAYAPLASTALASEPLKQALLSSDEPALPFTAVQRAKSSGGASFEEIAAGGLDNACYPDDDHYVAEFLHQNPDVCLWEVDADEERVTAVAVPTPPDDAIPLPAPSGRDDTAALESLINDNPGRSFVGSGGVYRVGKLDLRVPADIHDMPMRPWRGSGIVVRVHASDVRIYSSPIDAEGSSTTHIGFRVEGGAERFVLINSGFSNIHHRSGRNAAGVYLEGATDFHIACNTFENLINDTRDRGRTARANSILMNGHNRERTSGGVIANNRARNHQSNGSLRDSEFLTVQSFRGSDERRPTRVFANRAVDAGKRFSKHQESDALVLSNSHAWIEKQGPLGRRSLLSHVEIQFSDRVAARNNRVKVAAKGQFDYLFHTTVAYGRQRQDDVHYDCNDIEIVDRLDPSANSFPKIIAARAPIRPSKSTGFEATNSSANNNRVHGEGAVHHYYWFGEGYSNDGGGFETRGNSFEVPTLSRPYK